MREKELSPINLSLRHRSSMHHVAHVGRFLSWAAVYSLGKAETLFYVLRVNFYFYRKRQNNLWRNDQKAVKSHWSEHIRMREKGKLCDSNTPSKKQSSMLFLIRDTQKSISIFFEVCSLFEKERKFLKKFRRFGQVFRWRQIAQALQEKICCGVLEL